VALEEHFPNWHQFPIEELAKQFGTPFFLFDLETLRKQCARIRKAFPPVVEFFYAVKANPNVELLRILKKEALVDGLDVASIGEYALAVAAGWSPKELSVAGPGKGEVLLERCVREGVGVICVESLREFQSVVSLGKLHQTKPKVMLRINPNQEPRAFSLKISGRPNPFGFDQEAMGPALEHLLQHANEVDFKGVHVHAGSQCFSAKGMARHCKMVLEIVEAFEAAGCPVDTVNFGGGFGVSSWKPVKMLSPESVSGQLGHLLSHSPVEPRIRFELGRYVMAPIGVYVAQVVSEKLSREQQFYILDGGMNHFYAATHPGYQEKGASIWVENLSHPERTSTLCQLCGPLCTPYDRVGLDVALAKPEIGDLIGWPNAGAYGLTMSPMFFLGHPTPPEILFEDGSPRLIRPRRTPADFW